MNLDELIQSAELGVEAENFIRGNLGLKMLELADAEVERALLALAEVPPADEAKIRDLQLDVRFGRTFGRWLLMLAHQGEQAIAVFKQQQEAA